MNGEMRAVQVEDKNAAIETTRREKASNEPGSIGCKFADTYIHRHNADRYLSYTQHLCQLLLLKFEFTRGKKLRLEIRKL